MHWHWAMVVICSTGYSPRQSLQDTSGSRARSQVGRYLAVVIAEQSETRDAQVRPPHLQPPQDHSWATSPLTSPGGEELALDGAGVSDRACGDPQKFEPGAPDLGLGWFLTISMVTFMSTLKVANAPPSPHSSEEHVIRHLRPTLHLPQESNTLAIWGEKLSLDSTVLQ